MKSNIKIIGTAIASLMIGGLTVAGANQAIQAIQNTEIKVNLNGQTQVFKDESTGETQYPITYNDRTYLPLRNIAQLCGLEVNYIAETNSAYLSTSPDKIYSLLGNGGPDSIERILGDDNKSYYVEYGGEAYGTYTIYDSQGNIVFNDEGYNSVIKLKDMWIDSYETYDVKTENYSDKAENENYEYYRAYYKLVLVDGKIEKKLERIDKNDIFNRQTATLWYGSGSNRESSVKLGRYKLGPGIVTDTLINYDDVGVTLSNNNLCYIYEGFGGYDIGVYSVLGNRIVCNTLFQRNEEGTTSYVEQNIIYEFETVGGDSLKLISITNNSKNLYDENGLRPGMIYKFDNDQNIDILTNKNPAFVPN